MAARSSLWICVTGIGVNGMCHFNVVNRVIILPIIFGIMDYLSKEAKGKSESLF